MFYSFWTVDKLKSDCTDRYIDGSFSYFSVQMLALPKYILYLAYSKVELTVLRSFKYNFEVEENIIGHLNFHNIQMGLRDRCGCGCVIGQQYLVLFYYIPQL